MKKSRIAFVFVGLVVGILVGMLSPTTSLMAGGQSGGEVAQEVLDAYSLANPNAKLKVLSVKENSGLYEIKLSTGSQTQGTYQTVYATKDGRMITQSLTNLTQYHDQLQNRKSFLDCLRNESVKIYGALKVNNTQIARASALQIQLLGGTNYLNNIYVDCSNNIGACANQGVKTLPSVKYNGRMYSGVKQYQWFQKNVGCELG